MKYFFHEAAEEEFFASIEFYESCQIGLGLRFSEEVYATIKRICAHPNSRRKPIARSVPGGVRRREHFRTICLPY